MRVFGSRRFNRVQAMAVSGRVCFIKGSMTMSLKCGSASSTLGGRITSRSGLAQYFTSSNRDERVCVVGRSNLCTLVFNDGLRSTGEFGR